MTPTPTHHARRRMNQRLRGGDYRHRARDAWIYGLRPGEAVGDLRRYMIGKTVGRPDAAVRLYRGTIYIYNSTGRTLITVYPVPPELQQAAREQEERRATS